MLRGAFLGLLLLKGDDFRFSPLRMTSAAGLPSDLYSVDRHFLKTHCAFDVVFCQMLFLQLLRGSYAFCPFSCFSFFKDFIYISLRDRERERGRERERQRHRQREKAASCREPDMGLDPGTPGSCPGPKAGAKLLNHPGCPMSFLWLM